MNDLVSVCIPVYNGEEYLADCLNSIINQTYNKVEILIIDDNSNDGSVTIIKKFQARDSRIRLIINDRNLGAVHNWNKCIEEAKGNWIKFVFQDDLISSMGIEKMLSCCFKNNVSVCICSRDFIIEDSASPFLKEYFTDGVFKIEEHFTAPKKITPLEFASLVKDKLFINIIGEPIVLLFQKKCIERIGRYNYDLVQLVDYEFVMRL